MTIARQTKKLRYYFPGKICLWYFDEALILLHCAIEQCFVFKSVIPHIIFLPQRSEELDAKESLTADSSYQERGKTPHQLFLNSMAINEKSPERIRSL